MMCCNPKFRAGSNLSFFGLGQIDISQILLLMTSFELFFSKLSENPKNLTLDPRNSSYGSRKNP